MIGSLFAFTTAILYAANTILIRRAVLKVTNASIGILISVPMAVPLFFLTLVFTGQVRGILTFSFQSYVWLSLAGILHFVVGRSLYYGCVQLVGANIASLLRRSNILVSVVIGITVLHEPLSWQLATGVLLIMAGITLAGLSPQKIQDPDGRYTKIPANAFVLGFGCGAAWGVAPILVKVGLQATGSPVAGAFISFLAATVVIIFSMVSPEKRISITDIPRKAAGLFFTAGLLSFGANLARYVALSLAPASVITPLVATSPVFLLVFSFVFNRNLEIFNTTVIVGTITVVAGTILII
jgi:drug/metabolite transporter, DME family